MTEPELRVNKCSECNKITLKDLRIVQVTEIENLDTGATYRAYPRALNLGLCDECFIRYQYQAGSR